MWRRDTHAAGKMRMHTHTVTHYCFIDIDWCMFFSFCVHMMEENNYKTKGLADCSDNLVLPSVESAEFCYWLV